MNIHELQQEVSEHLERQNWPAAAVGLRRLVASNPTDAGVLIQLSYTESFLGRYRAARDAAIAAAKLPPKALAVAKDVVTRLRTFNESALLKDYLVRLGPPSRLPIPLLLTVAAQLSYANEQEAALVWLDEAKRADPDYPGTMLSRAQVLIYLGRWQEADNELEACMRRAPEIPELYRLLAQRRKATSDDNHVARIRALLGRAQARPIDTVRLAYALHRQLDELGDFAGAWQALDLACRTMRKTLRYAPSDTRALFDALIAMPKLEGAHDAPPGAITPIFIVGMHRSGTTLLEQLVNANSDVHGIGESYDFTSAMRYAADHHCKGVLDRRMVERAPMVDFAEVGQRYLDGMARRIDGKRFLTDKLPSNFHNIGFICAALPQARILNLVRNPMETCFSNLRELFAEANPYSYDQEELADFFLQYRRLMAHWHQLYPGRILDVPYAELTRDPEPIMRKVAAFCGLEYQAAMCDPRSSKRAVATASAVQVREGIIEREVPKWLPYADALKPLARALAQ